ncbi:MAG: hypothetical protein WDO15_11435 [Bacteroidota bacterium]
MPRHSLGVVMWNAGHALRNTQVTNDAHHGAPFLKPAAARYFLNVDAIVMTGRFAYTKLRGVDLR